MCKVKIFRTAACIQTVNYHVGFSTYLTGQTVYENSKKTIQHKYYSDLFSPTAQHWRRFFIQCNPTTRLVCVYWLL